MLKTPKFWYQNRISFFSILILPISLIWIIGTFLKKRFAKPIRSKIPVIAVGSAIIGGSGKTPSVIYVCKILEKMGHRPHIISKGYGGSANQVIKVAPEMNYLIVGDEAIMMSKYYPTWVSKKKYNAFSFAEKEGASVIVLDDALQSYNLYKNLSIYVYDSIQSFGNRLIIPSGPLREPIGIVLKRSQIVFLVNTNNCPEINEDQFQQNINFKISIKPEIRDKKVMPFAGLGFNKKFFDQLYKEGLDITAIKEFPDHHHYTKDDMFNLLDEANKHDSFLVTTEKDHLRIPKEFKSSVGIIYGEMVSNNQTDLVSEIEKYI
jgi:tetraacyldisaccharide 4'-kinase